MDGVGESAVGVVIALLVLLPETLAAVRNARLESEPDRVAG
jgi:Ca2+/H+ antiporter